MNDPKKTIYKKTDFFLVSYFYLCKFT